MRVLVTGGAGFIGSHLVDRFISDGHSVAVLDDLSSGQRGQVHARATLYVADLRHPDAAAAVAQVNPEVIVHHAAQMDVRKSVTDPALDADINITGMLRILEAARHAGALKHVIFASSGGAMYGEQDVHPAPETHPVRPESPYGLAKSVAEQYLAWYRRMYGITSTSLRYGNVYGPRQNPHGEAGVVAIFCARILAGQGITVFGDGGQTRDYVFVEDVVAANAAALSHLLDGSFNVGTGTETDVNALARHLIAAAGSATAITYAPPRPGEQRRSVIDGSALQRATGFVPQVSVADGLARTFQWFAARMKGGSPG